MNWKTFFTALFAQILVWVCIAICIGFGIFVGRVSGVWWLGLGAAMLTYGVFVAIRDGLTDDK